MKRRLFNLAALVSVILCLACLFMWLRSGFVDDYLSVGILEIRSGGAALEAKVTGYLWGGTLWISASKLPPAAHSWAWRAPSYTKRTARVVRLTSGSAPTTFPIRELLLPYWLPTLVAGFLPALRFWRWRKEKRLARRGFVVEVTEEAAS